MPACKASLAALGLDYLDLWLMHYPAANDPDTADDEIKVIDVPYTDTWRAMEECVEQGLVRNIGVSSRFSFHDRQSGFASSPDLEREADARLLKGRTGESLRFLQDQTSCAPARATPVSPPEFFHEMAQGGTSTSFTRPFLVMSPVL
jgi:hypothetical protein